MASNTSELLPILKALREYIVKEYGVNYPPHVRGEDASGKDLPADWVDKLNPLSGGDTVGRVSHGSKETKSTKAGAQGVDPYLHKSDIDEIIKGVAGELSKHFVDGRDVQAGAWRDEHSGMGYEGDGDKVPQGRGLSMAHDEEDMEEDHEDVVEDVEEEVEDEDMEEDFEDEEDDEDMMKMGKKHMYRSSDAKVSSLLSDIKGFLSARQAEKQDMAVIKSEFSDLKKSVNEQIKTGIKKGLKSFNLNPSRGDTPVRLMEEGSTSMSEAIPAGMPDQRIGVEGDSFQKSNDEDGIAEFTNAIEDIVQKTDVSDLKGHFKLVNAMRNQTGELTPHTLYYYPRRA